MNNVTKMPDQSGMSWQKDLTRTDKGLPHANVYNAMVFLEHLPEVKGLMKLNEFTCATLTTREPPPLIADGPKLSGPYPRLATEADYTAVQAFLQRRVRQQEKMLTLGPVLERFHNEALDPIITTTLDIMERGGLLKPRPENLQGHNIKIAYSSILAQAQRATETTGIEQFVRFVGGLVSVDQSIMDNVDLDAATDRYGDLLGIDPSVLRDPQTVADLRQQRDYQQQQQAAAEQAQQLAVGAKNLSQTDVGGGQNALQAIASGLGGE